MSTLDNSDAVNLLLYEHFKSRFAGSKLAVKFGKSVGYSSGEPDSQKRQESGLPDSHPDIVQIFEDFNKCSKKRPREDDSVRSSHNSDAPGHLSRNCPKKRKTDDSVCCRVCKAPGHMARECPDAPPTRCYNCQGQGHFSRECPEKQRQPGGSKNCYKCEGEGHIARDCPQSQRFGGSRGRGRGGGRGRSTGFSGRRNFGTGANAEALGVRKTAKKEDTD